MRNVLYTAAGAIGMLVLLALGGLMFLKTSVNGFSARAEPSSLERFAAKLARSVGQVAGAKDRRNPVVNSKQVIEEAMAHWADHCAVCHANDGSGQVDMGRQMYPHAPDMRAAGTQHLSDGELFSIIENGVRFTGMPAWGGSESGETASWKLVYFIRHLPALTPAEIAHMEKLNPKSPEDREEEQQEEQFLSGRTPKAVPPHHKH